MRASSVLALLRAVFEPGVLADEGEVHVAGGAVALFADADSRLAPSAAGAARVLRALAALVELLAVDEHDDVRVLLYRAGLAQVRQERLPVRARLDRAV